MRRVAAVLACLAAAGCAGGDEPRYDVADLPRLVLSEADLGAGWVRFDGGRQTRAEAGAEPGRHGREDGWKSRLRRPGESEGPLVVESRADLFADGGGAGDELAALAEGAPAAQPVPALGDDAFAWRADEGDVDYVTIAWRRDNVVARVVVSGFGVELADARAIARRQDARFSTGS